MSDDLRTRIAAVIAAHGFAGYDPEDSYTNANWPCSCDWLGRTAPEYQQHVADLIIAELGLKLENEYNPYDPFPPPWRVRYVTDWKADE